MKKELLAAIAMLVLTTSAVAGDNPAYDPNIPLFAGGIWDTTPDSECPKMSLDFFQGESKSRGTLTISYEAEPNVSGGGSWSLKGHAFTIATYRDKFKGTVKGLTITAQYATIADGKLANG